MVVRELVHYHLLLEILLLLVLDLGRRCISARASSTASDSPKYLISIEIVEHVLNRLLVVLVRLLEFLTASVVADWFLIGVFELSVPDLLN